ncbi:MAG: terminase large subunit [Candidatus Bathyarchaeota archaeon]|nr:terminase large subunit [Candidatus Bathyarchaeota archaeon]
MTSLERQTQKLEQQIKQRIQSKQPKFQDDPIKFFEETLGFQPTKYQQQLSEYFLEKQFVAARWCRQSGKSHIIAALLLYYALTNPKTSIGIVGPSYRQAKLIIRKITGFLRLLPKNAAVKARKTVVYFGNGSVIECYPNNPDTIRGPTLHLVYWDEMNFTANDEEMYDAILFTLGTTNGKFVCSSTPWSTDHVFYRIFNHPDFDDFAKSHVTWQDAVEPNGPLKSQILEKIRKQLTGDPWRWHREMEAQWAEDESRYFPQELITKCVCGNLVYASFERHLSGRFCVGVDLGKKRDHSAVAVVQLCPSGEVRLIHLHRFKLGTPYASVIGYVKALTDRYATVEAIYVDQTGIGEYVTEDMKTIVTNTKGVVLTGQRKEEILSHLRELMQTAKLSIPYDSQLIAEIHCEKFELTKDGHTKFSHPEGTHDDRLWALALACMSTRKTQSPSKLVRAW